MEGRRASAPDGSLAQRPSAPPLPRVLPHGATGPGFCAWRLAPRLPSQGANRGRHRAVLSATFANKELARLPDEETEAQSDKALIQGHQRQSSQGQSKGPAQRPACPAARRGPGLLHRAEPGGVCHCSPVQAGSGIKAPGRQSPGHLPQRESGLPGAKAPTTPPQDPHPPVTRRGVSRTLPVREPGPAPLDRRQHSEGSKGTRGLLGSHSRRGGQMAQVPPPRRARVALSKLTTCPGPQSPSSLVQ